MLKKILLVVVFVLICLVGGFLYYQNDYYRTDPAINQLLNDTCVDEQEYYFCPGTNQENILIMPGGKVEESAYLFMAEQLQQNGYNVYVSKSFLKLSIIDSSAAKEILNNGESFTVIGHSLGGTVASMLYEEYSSQINNIIFLGSYPYSNIKDVPTLAISASNDLILNQTSFNEAP